METCRFCLENIHEIALTCSHCGYWQPNKTEIADEYRKVLIAREQEILGTKKWRTLFIFWPFAFLLCIGGSITMFVKFPSIPVAIISLIIIAVSCILNASFMALNNIFRRKIVFEEALLLEERLNNNLKKRFRELQVRRDRSKQGAAGILGGVFFLLALTNPSTQEFQAYYAQKEEATIELKDVNRTNLVIFSRYQVESTEKKYWGVLGNFFP